MPTLNWIGKDKVVTHHQDVPFRVLNKQYTFGDTPDSGNMIIPGDNLIAEQKIRLGNLWTNKAGNGYRYFLVYKDRQVEGAYTKSAFIDIMKNL